MIIKRDNNLAFTSFKLKNNGARVLAEKFIKDPSYEENFNKMIIKPLSVLKTSVIYDGSDVFVKNKLGNRKVLDSFEKDSFWGHKNSVFEVYSRFIKDDKYKLESYYIQDGGKSSDRVAKNSQLYGISPKFLIAKEIALFEDKIISKSPKLESVVDIKAQTKDKSKVLKHLYGK